MYKIKNHFFIFFLNILIYQLVYCGNRITLCISKDAIMLGLLVVRIFLISAKANLKNLKRSDVSISEGRFLFDFTKEDDVHGWQEQSDTVRSVGMSKAVFVMHQNTEFRRAIFFALLNPQINGAGFAGTRALGKYDLTGFSKLQIFCRGQGQFNGFKIVLRHKGLNDEPNYSFEQYFQAPKDEFAVRNLPFSEFKAYYRGKRVNNNETLDISQVTSIGIQMYGGVYQPIKQKGPATLEVDWIKAL